VSKVTSQQRVPLIKQIAMRIIFLFTLLVFNIGRICLAQDIISTYKGDKISAKVLKIMPDDIEYKLFDNQEGPLHTIAKADVSEITYENGSKDVFNNNENSNPYNSSPYNKNMTLADRGYMDAQIYYRPQMAGAVVAGLFFGYGFIPGIISYATPPRYENLNFPDRDLMDKYEYREAYMAKACQIKRRRVAEGFGIGTGIVLSLVVGLTLATMNH
jgi:hypothetical protein